MTGKQLQELRFRAGLTARKLALLLALEERRGKETKGFGRWQVLGYEILEFEDGKGELPRSVVLRIEEELLKRAR